MYNIEVKNQNIIITSNKFEITLNNNNNLTKNNWIKILEQLEKLNHTETIKLKFGDNYYLTISMMNNNFFFMDYFYDEFIFHINRVYPRNIIIKAINEIIYIMEFLIDKKI